MLEVLISILIGLISFFGAWLTLSSTFQSIKYRTQVSLYLFLSFFTLGFGVLYDCIRIVFFMFFDGIYPPLDLICYFFKIFLLFVGVSAVLRLILILNKQSGQIIKREKVLRYFYIIAAVILSILNYYTYEETSRIENGFLEGYYNYQISPLLHYLVLILYIPLFFFLVFRVRKFLQVIKKEYLVKGTITLVIILAALFIERNLNLAAYLVFDPVVVIIIELSLIFGIALSGFILFNKYPNFIEEIGVFFALKSIYILWNNGGILLYKHIFKKQDPSTPDRLLMGGFLFAMSSGVEEAFKVKGGLKSIKVGNTILLFAYGEYVFGMTFMSESSPLVQQRLKKFIETFEHEYEEKLRDWEGDLSIFDSNLISGWMTQIFR